MGNPPTLRALDIRGVRILGGLLNYDENMSPFKNRACASCHMPYAAFSGPIPSVNLTMIAYPGTFRFRAGKRTAQRYTYSPTFPVLKYNTTQGAVLWRKLLGCTRDRISSCGVPTPSRHSILRSTPRKWASLTRLASRFGLSQAVYRPLFELVWGADLRHQFPSNTEQICATPEGRRFGGSATPIALSPEDRTKANNVYDHWGQSLSFLERSTDISPFTSKFDAFLKRPSYTLTADEMAGYNLFSGKGNCNSCHLDGRSTAPATPGQTDTGTPASVHASVHLLRLCQSGLPLNPRDAFYYQTTPDCFGFTPNPDGFRLHEISGLGTFLRSGSAPLPIRTRTG